VYWSAKGLAAWRITDHAAPRITFFEPFVGPPWYAQMHRAFSAMVTFQPDAQVFPQARLAAKTPGRIHADAEGRRADPTEAWQLLKAPDRFVTLCQCGQAPPQMLDLTGHHIVTLPQKHQVGTQYPILGLTTEQFSPIFHLGELCLFHKQPMAAEAGDNPIGLPHPLLDAIVVQTDVLLQQRPLQTLWVMHGLKVSGTISRDGNLLLREFNVTHPDRRIRSISQRIGWDPLAGGFNSWTFDSNGGYSEGLWKRQGESWIVNINGVLPDGKRFSATSIHSQINDTGYLFESVGATVEGKLCPDQKVKLLRQASQK
jgi:hypothetical protein